MRSGSGGRAGYGSHYPPGDLATTRDHPAQTQKPTDESVGFALIVIGGVSYWAAPSVFSATIVSLATTAARTALVQISYPLGFMWSLSVL